MRIPQTIEQLKGDYFMLGIEAIAPSVYQVGPTRLYGPAMEEFRQSPLLRTSLILANPKVPNWIKKRFATDPEILGGGS